MEARPAKIFSGFVPHAGHCQGIATDGTYFYYSFTTVFLKTDLAGNQVGSVRGMTGHLGCIAWSETDRRVYGSLEYKNDAIGRGIMTKIVGSDAVNPDAFYLARFDVDKITRMDMEADEAMTVVRLNDVCEDYAYRDGTIEHRFGCSGIDGITFVPDHKGTRSVFVAYGIYGDTARDDNDDQVLVRYDAARLDPLFRKLDLNAADGVRCDEKLFVRTGNTVYGIQNLEYDAVTGCLFAAVYRGKKPQFPNYPMYLFSLDGEGNRLKLAERGVCDPATGIRGSLFGLGSTGMISLGDGYWYFSSHGHDPEKGHYTEIGLYRFDGDAGFEPVN